ncbi:hypothetical protein CC1G_06243 [Coprinopsis cinerea okayama7|uniref:Uncharacterized protein n=1 Tax=Coprinopsis cinerea (strain Okayama-7 / 130 / ATCC MYA-4618 / FGSC 9003) TaxID=240176 RepID=A8NVC7_COPC7|nr:hypothetical protein CC1G_06243 [Coprinopsis cinerea okayama7\|eukprot:XP_001836656.1 hypothetical protein CC1G_06243 [Coprinopsis cinerea okayama7\
MSESSCTSSKVTLSVQPKRKDGVKAAGAQSREQVSLTDESVKIYCRDKLAEEKVKAEAAVQVAKLNMESAIRVAEAQAQAQTEICMWARDAMQGGENLQTITQFLTALSGLDTSNISLKALKQVKSYQAKLDQRASALNAPNKRPHIEKPSAAGNAGLGDQLIQPSGENPSAVAAGNLCLGNQLIQPSGNLASAARTLP